MMDGPMPIARKDLKAWRSSLVCHVAAFIRSGKCSGVFRVHVWLSVRVNQQSREPKSDHRFQAFGE
jgi:hypothetical protein